MNSFIVRTRSVFSLIKVAMTGKEKNFTTISVARAAFLLSLPAMIELLIESLFVVIDLLYVSRLGDNAINVAGMTGSIILVVYAIPVGLNIAASSLIARRIGEKKPRTAGLTAVQSIYTGVAAAILFSVLAITFSKSILHALGATGQMVQEGQQYMQIRFGCIIFLMLRVLLNGIFRGAGDAAMAMRTFILAFLLNALLGGIFIFGFGPVPALGLTGAAIANGIANMLAVSYQFYYFRQKKTALIIGRSQLNVVPSVMKKLWKLGAVGTLQYLIPASSWLLMITIVAQLGKEVLTGYIIADRIIVYATLPAWGIANAAGVLTGQNLGAGKPERAEQSVWKTGLFNMYFLGIIACLLLLFTGPIVGIFTSDPGVKINAMLYLQCMAVAFFFFGYTMVISRSLNAAGYMSVVTWMYILMFYIIQLPLAYGLGIGLKMGSKGIFGAILLSEIVLATGCIIIFRKGKWKNIRI
ncbi:MATE family efflux transporter [Chitinophaga sp. Cy-1792]|uniref:MATE family efflux transporter n=1 Tax=Chitinophaga sp. Cy-1792 TaxID=2608339 RepID=UPI001422EC8A|nr:MATE family efflux transporter [Chitinophaga sp. Cy-1792]NIG56243.1 MATE family efflux transporter [Chitinophaga sp. Cy-1792]